MSRSHVDVVVSCYPQIYFACHKRYVRDDETQQLLSGHQASVLDHLDDVQAISLFDLARHMGVTASTMSLTIDRLQRGGYVLRERSAADRRRVDLLLTPAGVRIKNQQKVLEPELVAAVLAQLDNRKRREAVRGLELLAEASLAMIDSGGLNRFLRKGAQ